MEVWAKSHELDEWHCRCEDIIGTAYPRNLCPVCCVESSINWRDGKPYYYCPDHGELDDLYSEPNAKSDGTRRERHSDHSQTSVTTMENQIGDDECGYWERYEYDDEGNETLHESLIQSFVRLEDDENYETFTRHPLL